MRERQARWVNDLDFSDAGNDAFKDSFLRLLGPDDTQGRWL